MNGPEPWSIRVHDEQLFSRVLRDHHLGLGEAYMDGWWDCDRIDEMLTRVIVSGVSSAVRPSPGMVAAHVWARVRTTPTIARAKRNADHHYAIGDDLYARMLDKRMVYSCAYWHAAHDLDSAQEAKLDLICRKLQLEPGTRLLDIGCGWGALAQFAAERYGAQVVGITPAANQVAHARRRCAGLPVQVYQSDYRHVTGTFDRIVSVGMLEHVGARFYREFLQTCARCLARDGVMLHHTIGKVRSGRTSDPWFSKYIFPGGMLPSVAQLSRAAEPEWVVEDVHNFGLDYERTLLAWHTNIEAAWGDLPGYDQRFQRMWRYYLLASAAGFRARENHLWQVVFRRKGRAHRYHAPR